MSMICPECNKIYEQQEQICPTCSIHLMFYARLAPVAAPGAILEEESSQWQHTAWGRIAVGLILAQGLALGLKQLLTAGLHATGDEALLGGTWIGLALLHSLHAVGLLCGGIFAGAGQQRGALIGGLMGLGSGLITLALQAQAPRILPDALHFAQPLLHVLFGMMGGCIGTAIWTPTPKLTLPESKTEGTPPPSLIEMRWLRGPIAWWRVIAGATLMTCGIVWSNLIMNWMIEASLGSLTLTTHFQAKLVSWEVAGLTMLIGATLAGATTFNGTKQGLCVGIGAAVLYIGYQLARFQAQPETIISAIVAMLGIGLLGGWFGGQMFPPLGRGRRRRRIADW
jgi:hypothetical protein